MSPSPAPFLYLSLSLSKEGQHNILIHVPLLPPPAPTPPPPSRLSSKQGEHIFQWPLVAIYIGFLCSHLLYRTNYCKCVGLPILLYIRIIPQVLSFTWPCDLERRSRLLEVASNCRVKCCGATQMNTANYTDPYLTQWINNTTVGVVEYRLFSASENEGSATYFLHCSFLEVVHSVINWSPPLFP